MRSSTVLFGLVGLASVNARAILDQPYKRHDYGSTGTCAPQSPGSGPVTNNPDTDDAFLSNTAYDIGAYSAQTPNGWKLAYRDLKAASTTGGYLGVSELTSYDPSVCAAQCCSQWPGCTAFNIYYERDPTVDPGDSCPNPPSTTRIKCSFWSQSLSSSDATNDGQYCADFHIVIAGSNAYNVNGACSAATTTTTSSTTSIVVTSSTSITTSVTTSTSNVVTTSAITPTTTATTSSAATTSISTGTGPCANGAGPDRTYTASNGDVYGVCLNTDFPGGNLGNTIANGITTPEQCADVCSRTPLCIAGNIHDSTQICYLKSTLTPASPVNGVDGVYKISSGTPFSSTTVSTTTSTRTVLTTTVQTTSAPITTTTKSTTTTSATTTAQTTPAPTTTTTKSSTTTTKSTTTSGVAPLSSCPVAESTYYANDGSTWAICKGTNYNGGQTTQTTPNVRDDNACADVCDALKGCLKAAYNPATKVCTLKTGSLVWTLDPTSNAIRQLTPSTIITSCPTAETKYTAYDGSTYAVCPNSDYPGGYAALSWQGITSDAACADKCAGAGPGSAGVAGGCTKAIWDKVNNVCFWKTGDILWISNPKKNAIRQLTPAPVKVWTPWAPWKSYHWKA